MALVHCNFFSEVLKVQTSMDVILPQGATGQIGMESNVFEKLHPTLYLLHGLSDDHTIWQRRTSIERYVAEAGIAVVMPNAGRSFYCDMDKGYKYWTFISEEVPKIAREFFHLSAKREDNFVAGVSMGGYGAVKLGLTYPERYAAIGSFSGVLDINRLGVLKNYDDFKDLNLVFNYEKGVVDDKDDIFLLTKKLAEYKGEKPLIYQYDGTKDFLFVEDVKYNLHEDNLKYKKYCEDLGLEIMYEEDTGAHNWTSWDKMIPNFIEKLPLRRD
jgi:S-formylglutathione hydrolase FrmB